MRSRRAENDPIVAKESVRFGFFFHTATVTRRHTNTDTLFMRQFAVNCCPQVYIMYTYTRRYFSGYSLSLSRWFASRIRSSREYWKISRQCQFNANNVRPSDDIPSRSVCKPPPSPYNSTRTLLNTVLAGTGTHTNSQRYTRPKLS